MLTKTESDVEFPSIAYAYVPDAEKPSTWKLRLWETPETKVTARQVGMAIAALSPEGFRGNRVEIPAEDLPAVKRKVLAAWKSVHDDKATVPNVLKSSMEVAKMTADEISEKLDDMEKELDAVRKRAETAEGQLLVAQLEPEDREAYDALPETERATFVQADDAARSELLEKGRKAIAKRDDMPESIQKRFDEVTKRLEDVTKQLDTANARAAAAETVAKKEQDARKLVELAKRAEEEYAGLPGTPDEKALVLKSIEDKLTPEEAGAIFKLFKAGNECLRGQMKEVGKSSNTDAGNGAWSKIEKKAEAMAAADVSKKLTVAKATELVIAQEPELYTEYLKETEK